MHDLVCFGALQVLKSHKRSDGIMEDYCDGSTYKEHSLFSSNPTALQIMLYYDDVEICNPLGSRAKVHKLGKHMTKIILLYYYIPFFHAALFYYTLGNIPPAYRSSLKCIQLVTVVKYNDLIKYGIDTILSPFMEDLKILEAVSGYNFCCHYIMCKCLWLFRMRGLCLRLMRHHTSFEELWLLYWPTTLLVNLLVGTKVWAQL